MRLRKLLLPSLLIAPALTACQGEQAPVARVVVEPETVVLTYPGSARLTASWELLEELPGDTTSPQVFVHLLEEPGQVARTFDTAFPVGWQVGEVVEQPLELWQTALGPPLAAGTYELSIGLYDPASGRRWPLSADGQEVAEREYSVAHVEVKGTPEDLPEVDFSDTWHPLEPTGDRQIFAHRWLAEAGGIELSELTGPLRVRLTLLIPGDEEMEGHRLVQEAAEAGAAEAGPTEVGVVLRSPCAAEEVELRGPGLHTAELTLAPPGGAGACTLELDPDFFYIELASFRRRSVDLQKLVWSPAEG